MQQKVVNTYFKVNSQPNIFLRVSHLREIVGVKMTPYQMAKLQRLAHQISQDLSEIFHNPICAVDSENHVHTYVFGMIEYRFSKIQKTFTVNQCVDFQNQLWRAAPQQRILIIKPLRFTNDLIGIVLQRWASLILDFSTNFYEYHHLVNRNISSRCISNAVENIFSSLIRLAIIKTINWKKIRNDLAKELHLSEEVLNFCKVTSVGRDSTRLNVRLYNLIQTNIAIYREVAREAPNVLWLLTLLIDENFCFEEGCVIQKMREIVLEAGVNPSGWRILYRSKRQDIRFILNGHMHIWRDLTIYLKLHVNLKRQVFIPKQLSYLFEHPHWQIKDELIIYRKAEFHPNIFNKLIDELSRADQDVSKLNNEFVNVILWLKSANPQFDHVQLKQSWAWFAKKAKCWADEQSAYEKFKKVRWGNCLEEITVSNYLVSPVTDQWSLMKLAVSQRHCIDQYVDECVNGQMQIFKIQNMGRTVATLLLNECSADQWEIVDLRGFANKHLGPYLWGVATQVLAFLNGVEMNGQLLLPLFGNEDQLITLQ